MKNLISLSFALIFATLLHAQIEGDALENIIGSDVKSANTATFLQGNNLKSTADGIYSSTTSGIDVRTKNNLVRSITLYRDNRIYGQYMRKLPKGIQFDMSNADIVKKLGKPTVEYTSSGYCEYHFPNYTLTCWFEKGVLRRVTLSSKYKTKI
jgi:hypothetical protein